jgi:hypothetical protein
MPAHRTLLRPNPRKRSEMAEFPAPTEGIVLTHFVVAEDIDRSRAFYVDVLGGEAAYEGSPSIVQLANSWIIINKGGKRLDADRDRRRRGTMPAYWVRAQAGSAERARVALAAST